MLVEEDFPGALGKMKQFASWFTHGVECGARLRKAIYEAKTAPQIVEAVDGFFGSPIPEGERSEQSEGMTEVSDAQKSVSN
jgi:hypothetical protein